MYNVANSANRKGIFLVFVILGLILIYSSCKHAQIKIQSAILKNDSCSNNPQNSYSLYIPSYEAGCNSMPLLIILDPKGSGSYAIQKFIRSAESCKCILAASNLVQNNYMGYLEAIENIIVDIRSKYQVGKNVYLAGFSGGARMAISFAQARKINGVIACGALASGDVIKSLNTNVYAIFGMGDFNLDEAVGCFLSPAGYPLNLKFELTENIHEWPSIESIDRAMCFLILSDYPKENTCLNKKELSKKYSHKTKILLDSLMHTDDYIKTYLICANVQSLRDLPDNKYFNTLVNSLKTSTNLKDAIKQLKRDMQFDYKLREAFNKALINNNREWWKKEINLLNRNLAQEKDRNKLFAYKRIHGFLGILCYSLAKKTLKTEDLNRAHSILDLYKVIEPQNPDMFYYTALYLNKSGKPDSVVFYLKKAIDSGFTNKQAIQEDFPSNISSKILLSVD